MHVFIIFLTGYIKSLSQSSDQGCSGNLMKYYEVVGFVSVWFQCGSSVKERTNCQLTSCSTYLLPQFFGGDVFITLLRK